MLKMKKFFAVLLTLAMIMSMAMTVFAAEDPNTNNIPEAADTAVVKITGLKGNPTVTLYQIAKGDYAPGADGEKGTPETDADNQELIGYIWATGAKFDDAEEPTAKEITEIANKLVKGDIVAQSTDTKAVTGTEYTKTVNAGAYIAVITGANDGSVYNPVLLTATYNMDGKLDVDPINLPVGYLYGTTAVVKMTTPTIDKTVEGFVLDESAENEDAKKTASVGDVLTYTITPTMPSYPKEAVNKTFFVTDTMSEGLTFDYATLKITIAGATVTKDGNNFKIGNNVIAKATKLENGFTLWFDYDNLISDAETGSVYTPIISYDAIVNEDAVVGNNGNINDAELYYSNKPNEGSTWEPENPNDRPDAADGVVKKEDHEVVYTYQLSFLKEDAEDGTVLANAVFGIYTDEDCTNMIDKVTTNENGYAVSTNVKAGTYYVKELEAPDGYSLNTTVYSVTANWTTATRKDTATVTDCTYTTEQPNAAAPQVGWIVNGQFYAMDEFDAETETVKPAYILTTSTTTTSTATITENVNGGGTVALADIPNTKLIDLPSTGGVGTTIFTVAGCAIMIAAAFFFFASRRKENN